MTKAAIFSVYMPNVNPEVAAYQEKCVVRCLPEGCRFVQSLYTPPEDDPSPHASALEKFISENPDPITILLDIDCIPLSTKGIQLLIEYAEQGELAGAIQRANHIDNQGHLYVAPSCMAFSNEIYKNLGSPKFIQTKRADIGEEVTYAWEKANHPVRFFWPTEVYCPMWKLNDTSKFGLGTTYQGLFYHSFCIRDPEIQQVFVEKCQQFLATAPKEITIGKEVYDETCRSRSSGQV